MSPRQRQAFVYGAVVGVGGLGVQVGNALRALALDGGEVHAIGPGPAPDWNAPRNIIWHVGPRSVTPVLRWRPFRRHAGLARHALDRRIGSFARQCLERVRPDLCYAFTQVALESLAWAKAHDVPGVLESPNGHIRAFRDVYVRETRRWCDGRYLGHPTTWMVRRVEREYALASHVRVSSEWARRSLSQGDVPENLMTVLQQPVDLRRYAPESSAAAHRQSMRNGPLRVCFVGSLDLRKGFHYLIRGIRQLGNAVTLELVGGTGDRCCRRLLEREVDGLSVKIAPGDPRAALAGAEVFALPTLEDGSPFAVAEAMASGLPVVTTTATGAAEWIRPGRSGWVVEPASDEAVTTALEQALARRRDLPEMGRDARCDTERRVTDCDEKVSAWVRSL